MKFTLKLLTFFIFFTPLLAQANFAVDCSHGVNMNIGNSTDNVTGQVECVRRGKPHIKTQSMGYLKGKKHGKTIDYDGRLSNRANPKNMVISVENYQHGKKHGKFMRYDNKSGKLEDEKYYSNDAMIKQVTLYPKGGKKVAYYHKDKYGFDREIGSISYNKAGQLSAKNCPQKASKKTELNKICGFGGGKQTTKLYDDKGRVTATSTQVNGKQKEYRKLYPSGKVRIIGSAGSQKFYYENGKLEEEVLDSANRTQKVTKYYPSGVKKKFTHTVERKLKTTKAWYMNGKLEYSVERQGNSEKMSVKTYYGNGQLFERYVYTPKERYSMFFSSFYRSGRLIGNSRSFHKNGKVWEDTRRDAKGNLTSRKTFFETGRLKRSVKINSDKTKTIVVYDKKGNVEEQGTYYPDGSTK